MEIHFPGRKEATCYSSRTAPAMFPGYLCPYQVATLPPSNKKHCTPLWRSW